MNQPGRCLLNHRPLCLWGENATRFSARALLLLRCRRRSSGSGSQPPVPRNTRRRPHTLRPSLLPRAAGLAPQCEILSARPC